MTDVKLTYYATFGPGDGSDHLEWWVELDGEAEEAYLQAKRLRLPFSDFPVLEEVLEKAEIEIADEETDNLLDFEDPYVQKCTGKCKVEPETINRLVADRDEHTLEYFDLTDMTDEELDEWDANDLYDLPDVCDFEEGFAPTNPFLEGGYNLYVFFAEDPESELEEEEARETLTELFEEANGDYTTVKEYINRCDDYYYGRDLAELAAEIAKKLGIEDYQTKQEAI